MMGLKRSATEQIEYRARVGKLAEEDPDLPFEFLRDTLLGLEELKAGQGRAGQVSEYTLE